MKTPCSRFVLHLLCVLLFVAMSSRALGADNDPAPTQAQPTSTSPEANNTQPAPLAASPSSDKVALEVGTQELSGFHDGALGFGWGKGGLAVGAGLAFHYSRLAQENGYGDPIEQIETALAVGPWLRWDMFRTGDDRVGMLAALDFQYCRQSTTLRSNTSAGRDHAVANGVIFRAGPGIRFWATPWLAVGYTAQVSVTTLWGPRSAFTPSRDMGPATDKFKQHQVALVGRFSVLALF